jgi:putative transposase
MIIKANQAQTLKSLNVPKLPARTMCEILGVSKSGYYAWKDRTVSQRVRANAALTEAITLAYTKSDRLYGAPKVYAELRDATMCTHDPRWAKLGKNRVATLMRAAQLRGVSNRRSYVVTTERDVAANAVAHRAPDLVKRQFVASGPNQLWVADITYVPTWAGCVYLAVVLDVWSRKVVGRHIGQSLHTDMILAALEMAARARAQSRISHLPQRSGLPVHKRCAWAALQGVKRTPVDENGW